MPDLNFMPEPEAAALLQQNGIPYPEFGFARSSQEAVQIAGRIGYPVVLKIVAEGVLHKSDIGGVVVNLLTPESVIEAFEKLQSSLYANSPGAEFQGAIVCRQVQQGIELIVGGLQDIMFGQTLMVGLGGIFTEILKDVSFRVVPIEKIDAVEMLEELKGYPVLQGARGIAKADLNALVDFLVKVSDFLVKNPWIKELDLNPVRISGSQIYVLDARILR
jgi:acyl-CoA synthetase (NDP forming)